MKFSFIAPLALAAALFAAPAAHAGPAWAFTAASNSFSNGSWDFGTRFLVNTTVTVTGLGYYADPNNGFVDNNEVALYNSTGVLLGSATVNNTFPLFGNFRYVTIAPVTLTAGNWYEVDGVSHSDNYTWNDIGFATDPAITYLGNTWHTNTLPVFQGNLINDVADGYWGPNVFFGEPEFAVPEPASMALLGAGLLGLGIVRRRRG